MPGAAQVDAVGWRARAGIAAALLGSALGLLGPEALRRGYLPGDAGSASALDRINLHWQFHAHGIAGLIASDLQAYPARTDRLVTDGLPLDALTSAPLLAVLGWPDGLWLWNILVLWGIGLSAAWAGARIAGWPGALITGAIYQSCDRALWATAQADTRLSAGLLLLPLVAGAACPSPAGGAGARSPGLAGLLGALAFLCDPGLLPGLLLVGAGPMIAARDGAGLARAGISAAATAAIPLAWLQSGAYELPGLSVRPWSPTPGSADGLRPVDLAAAAIYGADGAMLWSLLRPATALLIAARVAEDRPEGWRRWAVLGLIGCMLGLGAELPSPIGPLVLPSGWLADLPLPVSLLAADRSWAAVSLAGALLAAGAVPAVRARLRALPVIRPLLAPGSPGVIALPILLALAAPLEARLISPRLPVPLVPAAPSATARILAATPGLPVLLLPLPGGRFRPDHLDLLDQTWHGRPMAHGARLPSDAMAPDSLQRLWRQNAGLAALWRCEQLLPGEEIALSGREGAALLEAGYRSVYIDQRYVQHAGGAGGEAGEGWSRCVAAVLAGWSLAPSPDPLLKYEPGGA